MVHLVLVDLRRLMFQKNHFRHLVLEVLVVLVDLRRLMFQQNPKCLMNRLLLYLMYRKNRFHRQGLVGLVGLHRHQALVDLVDPAVQLQ